MITEQTTNQTLEDDKKPLENSFDSLEKKTRDNKRANFIGLQEESRKKSKKKHWKPFQNLRYLEFLKRYGNLFEKEREDKRLMKINLMMSNFVKTKSSTQCRSHHQKMELHYKSIAGIIAYFEKEIFSFANYQPEELQEMIPKTLQKVEFSLQEESFVHNVAKIQQLASEVQQAKKCQYIGDYFTF